MGMIDWISCSRGTYRAERLLHQGNRGGVKEVKATAGPVGEGRSLHGVTADMISYTSSKGLFAGMALDGALIAVSDGSNAAYYVREVRPTDILVNGTRERQSGQPASGCGQDPQVTESPRFPRRRLAAVST